MATGKEFKVNNFITLKLEQGKTFIYINERKFMQCIRLVLHIPLEEAELFSGFGSIDEVSEGFNKYLYENQIIDEDIEPIEDVKGNEYLISPEQEFWGHCSNLQTWYEHNYDTRILKSDLAFPLLKKLTEEGDPLAKKVFKEEIAKRLETGFLGVIVYLLQENYLSYFSKEEIITANCFNLLKKTNVDENDEFDTGRKKIESIFSLISFLKKKNILMEWSAC